MNDTIAIIVPIYNVERYLAQCIDSILMQTYQNLQIILVDDGSTDHCPEICDEYAKKDNRIHVIHKSNGGPSEARNVALTYVEGEYIALIDSDDFVVPTYLQTLYDLLIKHDCDIAQCTYESIYPGNEPRINSYENAKVTVRSNMDHLRSLYASGTGESNTACGKLYKKNIFDGIRFPVGKCYEDACTVHRLYYRAKKIVCIDAQLYKYVLTAGSITRSPFSLCSLNDLEALEARMDFYQEKQLEELYEKTIPSYCFKLLTMIHGCKKHIPDSSHLVCEMKKKLKKSYMHLIHSRYISLDKKLLYTAYCHMPYFYQFREARFTLKARKRAGKGK